MAPTSLYRHYAGDGRLLYVGVSLSAIYRLHQHEARAPWFREIARVDVEWFETREDALEAEFFAIRDEKPAHNIIHARSNVGLPPLPATPTINDRIEAAGYAPVSGYLPVGLADDVQALMDACEPALREALGHRETV